MICFEEGRVCFDIFFVTSTGVFEGKKVFFSPRRKHSKNGPNVPGKELGRCRNYLPDWGSLLANALECRKKSGLLSMRTGKPCFLLLPMKILVFGSFFARCSFEHG